MGNGFSKIFLPKKNNNIVPIYFKIKKKLLCTEKGTRMPVQTSKKFLIGQNLCLLSNVVLTRYLKSVANI